MAAKSTSLRAAVAFVTSSGVDLVEQLLAYHEPLGLSLVARGAPITQPSALERLAAVGVEVSVVVGARAQGFHPKLWLGDAPDGLHVLAGSGNVTAGGFGANDEQFEYLQLESDDADLIEEHERRFQGFAALAVPLTDIKDTNYWAEWERQDAERRSLADEDQRLNRRLAATADVTAAIDQLYKDLNNLYERTKAEVRIPAQGGGDRPYVASRFKQSIDRGYREGLLVPAVAGIVREPTEGLRHLAGADRPDLMVETLVLDTTKPYHHLFSETTKQNAQATMDDFYAGRPSR